MALAETIVAAAAGLAGAGIGAWSTSRASVRGARQAEIVAARADLAGIYSLIWETNYEQRQLRLAQLRYRLVHLDVAPEDIAALEAVLQACYEERRQVQWAVDNGEIMEEEAGISTKLIEQALAAADRIAYDLKK